jgi:heme-degrading monooxygenase HmoA
VVHCGAYLLLKVLHQGCLIQTQNIRRLRMLVVLFRSKLTPEAGQDYNAMSEELHSLVKDNPGFVDVKHFAAEDGERLTVVWFKDEESLRAWRQLPRHREAQMTGRQKWYEYYKMDVANIVRTIEFQKEEQLKEITVGD